MSLDCYGFSAQVNVQHEMVWINALAANAKSLLATALPDVFGCCVSNNISRRRLGIEYKHFGQLLGQQPRLDTGRSVGWCKPCLRTPNVRLAIGNHGAQTKLFAHPTPTLAVIPAQAGIQGFGIFITACKSFTSLDSSFRRNDTKQSINPSSRRVCKPRLRTSRQVAASQIMVRKQNDSHTLRQPSPSFPRKLP